jgi:predicted 2-oxoglutarate/Fe(II)-dependent dioxygenase YbiX
MSHPTRTEILGDRIVTIEGFASAAECDDLVRLAERAGFDDAPVTTAMGFVMMPDLRNNTRVILDDAPRAAGLWTRMQSLAGAPTRGGSRPIGLNERFRFYRYAPGQFFRWHRDGAFVRDARERSLSTVMLYLNDDFEGGSTDFDLGDEEIRVVPARGMALIFDHPLRHQGAPVVRGRKYVLRTDVMYRADEDRGARF